MASSSGNWLTVFILIAIGAILLVTINEANHGYFKGEGIKFGGGLKEEGGKLIDGFVEKFSDKKNPPRASKPPASSKDKVIKVNPNQKDNLGFKDRAELNEPLEGID